MVFSEHHWCLLHPNWWSGTSGTLPQLLPRIFVACDCVWPGVSDPLGGPGQTLSDEQPSAWAIVDQWNQPSLTIIHQLTIMSHPSSSRSWFTIHQQPSNSPGTPTVPRSSGTAVPAAWGWVMVATQWGKMVHTPWLSGSISVVKQKVTMVFDPWLIYMAHIVACYYLSLMVRTNYRKGWYRLTMVHTWSSRLPLFVEHG